MGVIERALKINERVEKAINQKLNILEYQVPGREQAASALLTFRQSEYEVWASGNPANLFGFYQTYRKVPGEFGTFTMQRFWEWIDKDSVKMHYPLAEMIMNQMKSLLFASEPDIAIVNKEDNLNDDVEKESDTALDDANQTLKLILDEANFNELCQEGVRVETYSGTLGWRYIMNTNISEYPFVLSYPAEKIHFRTELGKVQEIIFLDEYQTSGKTPKRYRLKSHYGKGYITHVLWLLKETKEIKEVPLDTLEETSGLKDIYLVDVNNKKIDIMLATFKKNRSDSNEFPNLPYGGSDFEGIIDTLHSADEWYSLRSNYGRKTRPQVARTEDATPYDVDTRKSTPPADWKNDMTIVPNVDNADDLKKKIFRDVPQIDVTPFDNAIAEDVRTAYRKIGISLVTANLEGVAANISGRALELKEEATVTVRSNKIKLWKPFLQDSFRLLLIYNSLKTVPSIKDAADYYTITETFDYDYQIEFPSYHGQTYAEKLQEAKESIGVLDRQTILERLLVGEYSEEEIKEIVARAKIENGEFLLPNQVTTDDPTTDE